ncbi:flagellar export chaperone FliS [Proteinivorax hydrogeniformans]|uniref:Flagellar export chaperone FliS n=1 Tax=Proteinivorax hydrogeniformans TaxID=1826727 RepID=A0AAU8HV08_9FIRM
MKNNPYQQYKQTQINTASPGELVLMLYNGAIKNLNQSIKALEEDNKEEFRVKIEKTQDIVVELTATLKQDEEISKNLASLYQFVINRLIKGHSSLSKEPVEEALRILNEMRDTWKEMLSKLNEEK